MHLRLPVRATRFLFFGVLLVLLSNFAAVASSSSSSFEDEGYLSWVGDYGGEYDRSLFLPSPSDEMDGVAIHWAIDSSRGTIRLAVAARAKGWVGFGLAELGGMPGSDVALFTASDRKLVDAHVGVDNGMPFTDVCQNWDLIRSQSDGNVIIFEAERPLDTGDSQDRPIIDDSNPNVPPHRIIAAWGDEKDVSYHGKNRVHGAIRWMAAGGGLDRDIFAAAMEVESEGYVDVTAEDHKLRKGHTSFAEPCFSQNHLKKLGLPIDKSLHVIGFEPLIGTAGSNLHHLGLVSYEEDNCHGSLGREGVSVYIWAPGEGPLQLPPGVGASVGKGSATMSYKLQVHYNPTGEKGLVDSSGVRLHFSTQLRKHELGFLEIGDPLTDLHRKHVGKGLSKYTFDCPSTCSERFDVGEVTVIREMLHMHRAGTRMTNTHIRNGKAIRQAAVEHYDYRKGGIISVLQDSYTVKRGDMFKTTCYYDADEETTFGFETKNEMCIAFLLYYPKQDIDRCGLNTMIESCASKEYDHVELSSIEGLERHFGVEPEQCEASEGRL